MSRETCLHLENILLITKKLIFLSNKNIKRQVEERNNTEQISPKHYKNIKCCLNAATVIIISL